MNKNVEIKHVLPNVIEVKLNFLGGIITHANDMKDVDVAIEEAMLCFIQAAEQFGKGLFKELNSDNT